MSVVLMDTNVLLYAHDQQDLERHEQATRLMDYLQRNGKGRLSVQCLAEFVTNATRKLKPPLTIEQAAEQVDWFGKSFIVYDLTLAVIREAVRGVRVHQLSYYDAQIWATARLNRIPVVFSEDFSAGQEMQGVRFVNPFAPDFAIEDWV